jgi:hypothetical protein
MKKDSGRDDESEENGMQVLLSKGKKKRQPFIEMWHCRERTRTERVGRRCMLVHEHRQQPASTVAARVPFTFACADFAKVECNARHLQSQHKSTTIDDDHGTDNISDERRQSKRQTVAVLDRVARCLRWNANGPVVGLA